jgi:hypothetical protein
VSFETGIAAGGNTVFHMVTKLQTPEKGWSGLAVPSGFLSLRRRVGLSGTIDGKPFWASAQPMGDGNHWVNISKAWRAENWMRGDEDVDVVFVLDDIRPELVLPEALAQVLNGDGLRTAWEQLSFTARKDDARWVGNAKRPETQMRRATAVAERLRQARPVRIRIAERDS